MPSQDRYLGIGNPAKRATRMLHVTRTPNCSEERTSDEATKAADGPAYLHQQDDTSSVSVVPNLMRIGVVQEKQLASGPPARFTADFDATVASRNVKAEMRIDQRLADTGMQRDVGPGLHDREHREHQARDPIEQLRRVRAQGAVARNMIAIRLENEALPFAVERYACVIGRYTIQRQHLAATIAQ